MTIAAIWFEDAHLWCAADTRLVAGAEDNPVSEIGSKIFSIPVSISDIIPGEGTRAPHYTTEYGFVFAGSALPAVLTVSTASTLLAKLGKNGGRSNPPRFEEIAQFIHRLAKRFIDERRRFASDGKFSAALFGWCPYSRSYKVAHIDARDDAGAFRVELSFPSKPKENGKPWLVLGSGTNNFWATLKEYEKSEEHITLRLPRRAIEKMIAESSDPTVGGATSVGFAHENGFEIVYTMEVTEFSIGGARRIFNGLDLDTEIGEVYPYRVAAFGVA